MRKVLPVFLALMILFASAAAEDDVFMSDFNAFAVSVFGIEEISQVEEDHYKSRSVEIVFVSSGSITLFGPYDNAEAVIGAACCVLRCVDNPGSMIDQYGRVLHAYFLCRSRGAGTEYRATTESGIKIYAQRFSDFLMIRIVK